MPGIPAATAFCASVCGGRLRRDRNRDRPAVVDDHEHHRQCARARQIERLVECALGGAAVADVGERAARLASHLERHGRAGRMQRLGGDGHAPGEIVSRTGEIVAALIAAPEQ